MDDSEYLRAEAQRCLQAATAAATQAEAERLRGYADEFERLAEAVESDRHIRDYLPGTGLRRTG
jgi:hypothetical protein